VLGWPRLGDIVAVSACPAVPLITPLGAGHFSPVKYKVPRRPRACGALRSSCGAGSPAPAIIVAMQSINRCAPPPPRLAAAARTDPRRNGRDLSLGMMSSRQAVIMRRISDCGHCPCGDLCHATGRDCVVERSRDLRMIDFTIGRRRTGGKSPSCSESASTHDPGTSGRRPFKPSSGDQLTTACRRSSITTPQRSLVGRFLSSIGRHLDPSGRAVGAVHAAGSARL
jgi:hypothetical protein